MIPFSDTNYCESKKNQGTLQKLFVQPVLANIKWLDIEVLFKSLGAVLTERGGSRVEVVLLVKCQSFIDHILRRIPKKAQSQQFENG